MANPAPPPPPVSPTDSVMLQKFSGLKNTVTRERLGRDELFRALNIDIDDVGQIHRRRGKTLVASGVYDAIWSSDEGNVYGVRNGVLGIINPNYSFVPLQSGVFQGPVAYVQVGNSVYFSDGVAKAGVIDQHGKTVAPWGSTPDIFLSPVVNPQLTLPAIRGKLIGPPPLATQLTYFDGRIYLAQGSALWYTELYLYNFVDKTRNFLNFESPITMLGTVTDGIYVGTMESVYFLSRATRVEGHPAGALKRISVMDSPVIPGSMVYIPCELANPPQVGLDQDTKVGVSILFLTIAGYCGGMDSGVCYNYTEEKFIFPDATAAAALFRRQDGINQYLAVTNSGGTPASNTRIGDHLDATIRRGGVWNTLADGAKVHDSATYTFISH